MFGDLRREVGEAISKVCKLEGVTIIKAATLPNHVHMYVSIPPKESVAKVVGRIKGKSSLLNSPSWLPTGKGGESVKDAKQKIGIGIQCYQAKHG